MQKTSSRRSLTNLSEALSGPAEFAKYLRIIDEATGRHIPLKEKMWDWQYEFLETLATSKKVVCLKARQIGISWLLMVYAFWCSQRYPGSRVLIFSKRLEDAVHLMERLKFLYQHIPRAWTGYMQITSPDTRQTVGFANGSQITALPSTPDAGRGRTAAIVIADEHAFHPYAESNWSSVEPAVERGSFIAVSTANGTGNLFSQLYGDAKTDSNGFTPVFLPWGIHPERDDDWYAKKKKELPVWQLHQEYPGHENEAFVQSGDPYFDERCCKLHSEFQTPLELDPLPASLAQLASLPGSIQSSLKVYCEPEDGVGYSIGVDPASGMGRGNDPSAICITNAETGHQVLEYSQVRPYDEVSFLIKTLSDIYPGITIVERNGVGAAVIKTLQSSGVPLWHEAMIGSLKQTATKRPSVGYSTQVASKMYLLALFEEAARQGWFKLASEDLIGEMRTYERREGKTPQAPKGSHDDRIMAAALSWLAKASVSPRPSRDGGKPIPWSLEWWDKTMSQENNDIDPLLGNDFLWTRVER